MKKFLVLSAMLGAMVFAVPSVEAKTAAAPSAAEAPQVRGRWNQPRRWNNRRVRTVTRTRITRIGRNRYREVIRVTYLPNGRVRSQVISRTRLGRW